MDLCPLGTATDHTDIVGRFTFPPDRRPGPHTGPPIPRRPGPVRGVSMYRASTAILVRTPGICCVEGGVRGIAEDSLPACRPHLPESACNWATTKLTEAPSRVDVAHGWRDPLTGAVRLPRRRVQVSATAIDAHSTYP